MDTILVGTILGGSIIMSILMYVIMLLLLSIKIYRGELKSDSKGIKRLRFQEFNPTWRNHVL